MKKEEIRFALSSIFEGMTSIRALISAQENKVSDRRIIRVMYDAAKADAKSRELAYLSGTAERLGFEMMKCSKDEIDAVTTGSSHGGIIAEATGRTIPPLSAEGIKPDGFYVMLEGIEDPYNFGYALRTIYAAGVNGAVLAPRNWMSASGVVCRASAGASELMPLFCCDALECVGIMKESGYKIACAGIRDSVCCYDADLGKPVFLIVGGEKRGISRALLDCADVIVRLDYGRKFNASLSAASAASVLAYEVFRQNR